MKKIDAVFERGGVRGIALVGAAAVVEEAGYTHSRTDMLYASGREAATAFLRDWDFEQYKRSFRQKEPPARGERLRKG